MKNFFALFFVGLVLLAFAACEISKIEIRKRSFGYENGASQDKTGKQEIGIIAPAIRVKR